MAIAQVLDLVRPEPRVETVLTNLKISGFRTFRELIIPQLARVNLFVGMNDAGKTSILEAVELVAEGTPSALVLSIARRGERLSAGWLDEDERRPDLQLDPSHLFHGHGLAVGERIQIREEGEACAWTECEIVEAKGEHETGPPDLGVRFTSSVLAPKERLLRLSPHGGLIAEPLFQFLPDRRVKFVTTGEISPQLSLLWDAIVLTPGEASVISALQIIEPSIERVAPSWRATGDNTFLVKLAGIEQRLPLGSLGDGIKRLLALALHLVSARGGVLLVDEIDTGLHHTVMADMWRLVIETARRLDVQVFATTHSLDCVHALAWVHQQSPETVSEVLLHRVEKDAPETVAYTLDELAVAARNHLEVR